MYDVEVRYASVGSLKIHPEVQREQRPHWVESLTKNFDPIGIGVLTAFDVDGELLIIDGAHRYLTLMGRGEGQREVPVLVFTGLSLAEQIHVFKLLNTTLKVDPYSLHELGLREGNEDDVNLKNLLAEYGWAIGKKRSGKTIKGIGRLKNMFLKDQSALRLALTSVNELYPDDEDASNVDVISGFWNFHKASGVFEAKDKRKLLKVASSVDQLLGSARAMRRNNRTLAQAVSDYMKYILG